MGNCLSADCHLSIGVTADHGNGWGGVFRSLKSEILKLKMPKPLWVVFVVSVVTNLMGQPVSALTVLPASFDEMVTGSQLIVHGRVVAVRSQATNGRRSIESVVTVAVIEAFKGNVGSEVMFRMPNGEIGRYRHVVVGAPEFAAGQEVVLFLAGRAPALPLPLGLSQGVFRVSRGGDGRATVASLPVADFGRRVRAAAAR